MANAIHCRNSTLTLVFMSCVIASAQQGVKKPTRLTATKVLGGKRICTSGGNTLQFVDESRLLVLAGPGPDCFHGVNDLELMVVSTEGTILARKPWPSTFPSVVLDSEQIALGEGGAVIVLDSSLRNVQTIAIPNSKDSTVFLRKRSPDTLIVRLPRGEEFALRGLPLKLIGPVRSNLKPNVIYEASDGKRTVALEGQKVLLTESSNNTKVIADLRWLFNCTDRCQAYDAGTAFSVSSHGPLRAAFISNGSKFPVTDAAGLFPFCRIVVIDLTSGKEIYRKQFITKTGQRSAQISPMGDLLVMSDGDDIDLQPLP